jgi:predicted ATPase/DNA-binding SARP family transcriptional activator
MSLRFGVLGPLEVRSGPETIDVRGAKRRALLAYLLVHAGLPQPLERLVDALDPEPDGSVSPATIQTYISQLRKLFGTAPDGEVTLVHRSGGYLLEIAADALDATRFEAAVAAASVEPDARMRLAALVDALALWRGPPLDEFAGLAWADDLARQWTRMYVLAQQLRANALLDDGNHRDARPALEQLVSSYPLHEPFWELLIVARYRCGEQNEALAAAREARAVLARELGVDPGPALVDLEARVLAHDPALAAPAAAPTPGRATTHIIGSLPTGVVTFLLTDIEGSSRLWDERNDDMAKALARYEDLVEEVIEHHRGLLMKWRGEGDSTMSVFSNATDACAAAVAIQRCLGSEVWPGGLTLRTRASLHSGEAQLRDGDYYGGTVNRAARIRGLAVGGETLLSRATHDLIADVLPDDVRLADVGEYEMTGLRRNENLFVLEAPGIESGDVARQMVNPQAADDFIGRVDDVERALDALSTPGIVTITGPGGIGKTRMMREVQAAARRGDRRYDRFYSVELAGARDRVAVEGALQAALVPDTADAMTSAARPKNREGVIDELAAAVEARRSLLALDNCEHVLDAVAELVAGLTSRCPNLSVLATSREVLNLTNERVIPLGPLALPAPLDASPDRLAEVEAIQLLVRRARDAGSELRLTADTAGSLVALCQVLDGVPLALELAAARLRSTTADELCARLEGQMHVLDARRGDPRHRSLYTAIDWSYQLLDPTQQQLMRRLAIFVGGFTLVAAEDVCGDDDGELAATGAVYVNLAELVSKSLVMFDRDQNRYRLLEPVRMFAREQLDEHGETDAVGARHAQWAFRASEAALAAQVFGTAGAAPDIVGDLDNVHAALDWLDASGSSDAFLRMVAVLGFIWFVTDWRRGRAAAARGVELAASARPRLRGAVLLSYGIVEQRAPLSETSRILREAIDIFTDVGDAMRLAWATFFLGRAEIVRDNENSAIHMTAAVDMFRALRIPTGEAWAVIHLGTLAEMDGDLDRARAEYGRARDIATSIGHKALEGTVVGELAGIAVAQGDLDGARRQLWEAIEIQRQSHDLYNVAPHLNDLALIEILTGNLSAARARAMESLRASFDIDDEWVVCEALLLLAVVLLEEGNPRDARRVTAATGWDVDPPEGLLEYKESIVAMAFVRLESILVTAYDDAAAEGRRAGRHEIARAFIAPETN